MALTLAIGCAGPGPLQAQAVPTGPSEDVAAEHRLDPVAISGKRPRPRGETVPALDTVDGRDLEDRGARDQQDLFKLLPGVQPNQGQPNQSLPTIRGIGTAGNSDQLGTQQSTTGFYVEDVPFSDPYGFVGNADIAPFDLARVEILRGPQGVLYGSASLGGAVNYVLNRPDLQALHATVLGIGTRVSHGGPGHALYAMLNMPVAPDVLGLRVVAFDRHDSGYITNLGTGQTQANRLRQRGGRLIGALQVGQRLRITGTLLTQRVENDDSFAVSPDPAQLTVDTPSPSTRHNEFTLRKLQVDLGVGRGLALTSITGLLDKRAAYRTDVTRSSRLLGSVYGPVLGFGPLPTLPQVTSLSVRPLWSHAHSQELRLASADDRPLQFVAGVLYQRTRFDWYGISAAPGGQALWGPAGVLLPNDQVGGFESRAYTRETAGFVDSEYRWPNGLSLGLGARLFRTEVDANAGVTFLGRTTNIPTATSEHGVTPKLSLKYRFGEHMAYVLAAKGYRFGGINLNPPALTTYRSDSLWNREVGLRLVPDPALRLDLTAFDMDWKDAQVSTLLSGPIPFVGVANVGQARSRGLETTLNWQATTNLRLLAALAYTDARTTAAFTASSGAVVPAGARLPGTALWQSRLLADVAFEGPAASAGRFSLTHSFVGRRVFDIEGRSGAAGHALTDVRLVFAKGSWEYSAGVDNLTDARAVGGASAVYRPGQDGYTDYYVVRPRLLGVSVRYER